MDIPQDMVITPGGLRHTSQVHHLSPGHRLDGSNGHLLHLDEHGHVLADLGPRRATVPGDMDSSRSRSRSRHRPAPLSLDGPIPGGFPDGWIVDGATFPQFPPDATNPISNWTATWKVPSAPTTQSGQTLFYFNGMENDAGILQPVLQWGGSGAGGGNYWAVACWYAASDGHGAVSSLVRVNPGDTLVGVMTGAAAGGGLVNVTCRFVGIAGTLISVSGVVPFAWSPVTLECYGITQLSDYASSDVAFTNIGIQVGSTYPSLTWTTHTIVLQSDYSAKIVSAANPGGEVDLLSGTRRVAPLLPGQRLVNGVSNFIFGTNMGQKVSPNGVLVTPEIQAKIKAGNFQIIRANMPSGQTTSYMDKVMAAADACGCQLLLTLDLNDLAWNEQVITYVGSNCNLYEFGNEPNGIGGGLDGAQYYTKWSTQVPTLRTFNTNAVFIGPAVTHAALTTSFISDWLTSCAGVGGTMLPDAVSFHHYVCDGLSSSACTPLSTVFSSNYTTVDGIVRGVLGYSLPLCLTEWNIAGGTPPPSYTADPTYATPWIHSAIDNMVHAGFAMACQFEAGTGEGAGGLDMISVTSPYPALADYQPIVDKNTQYLSGTTAARPYMVKIGSTSGTGVLSGQAITDMVALGIGGLFYQIPWSAIDTSNGVTQNQLPPNQQPSYNWGSWDSAIQQCNAANIDVYIALMGGSPGVPSQFQQADGTAKPSAMANFAAQVARAYSNGSALQRGTKTIAGIYCGNEDYSQGGSGGLPASLVGAMKACYPAIKAVNPGLTVIAGGIFIRNNTFDAQWWNTLMSRSTGAYINGVFQADAVSLHWHDALPVDSSGNPVELDPAGSIPSWNGGQGMPSFAQSWQVIQAAMAAQTPPLVVDVWADEVGMNVNTNPGGTLGNGSRNPGSVLSESTRMAYFKTILDSCRQSGIVKKIGFFTLAYFQGSPPQYTGPSLRDGQSLVQGPTDGTPSYGATFYGIQSYISQFPTWGSGGGGGGGGTPLTLTMPLASRFGLNYYHESMGYFGGSYSGYNADLVAMGAVTKNIKVYHNPLPQNSGTVSRATSLTLCQNIVTAAKAAGFYVVWVENVDQGQVLTDSTTDLSNPGAYKWKWSDYSAQVVLDAASAQTVGADEFLVGNEIQGSGHFYGTDPGTHIATTIYNGTNFPTNVKALVTSCKARFSGKVGYQELHTVSGNWVTSGLGSVDTLYFDLYDEWTTFQSKAQFLFNTFGNRVAIGETSAIDVIGNVGHYTAYTETDWARELMRRYDWARQVGIPIYLFTYGDPSTQGFGFTSDHSTYHDAWNYVRSSKTFGYTQYFKDTFPPNDFVGGTVGPGEIDVDSANTQALAPTPGTDFVYRGACIGYSTPSASSFRLVARYTDARNYYAINVNLSTQVVSFLRRQGSVETILGTPITWPPQGSFAGTLNFSTLYDFEIRVQGTGSSTQVAAFFNTYKLADQVDAGNVALNTQLCGLLSMGGMHAGVQNVVLSSLETSTTGSGGGTIHGNLTGQSGPQTVAVAPYTLQVNEWNSSATLQLSYSSPPAAFTITNSAINNSTSGAPGNYTSFYYGNHWGAVSPTNPFPLKVASITSGQVLMSMTAGSLPGSGAWDFSYDNWFVPSPTDNQGSGHGSLEMMIWLNHHGSIQPAGSQVATNVAIGGNAYDVWWNGGSTLSYVLHTGVSSLPNLDYQPILADAVTRGYLNASWYLIDIEGGFEIWQGGTGLAVSSFSVAVSGSGGGSGSNLTLYLTGQASSTIGTANTLYTAGGGVANMNTATTLGIASNWSELFSQGTASAWAGSGTAPTPSGNGFFLDTSALDGQQLLSGPIAAALRLNMIGTGAVTITADLHARLWRYTPSTGVYVPIIDCVLAGQTIQLVKTVYTLRGSTTTATPFAVGDRLYIDLPTRVISNSGPSTQRIQLNDLSIETGSLAGLATAEVSTPGFGSSTTGGPPSTGTFPIGSAVFGLSRLGDGSMVLKRSHYATMPITYFITASKYAATLDVSYTIMHDNVASMLVYYVITPASNFAINGDATIIVPDKITYNPRAVTGRTLLAAPIIQGYSIMNWTYTTIEPDKWAHLISYYNPSQPVVTLTYPDETGTWVQRAARMLPPVWGSWETMLMSGSTLQFVIPNGS